jgi:nitrate reductase gamma subunit
MAIFAKDPTIRKGFIFGAILGVIHIVFVIINNLLNWQGDTYAWLNRSFLITLILCLTLAGFFTFRAKSGARAGLTAGLVSAMIGIISLWIVTFLFMDVIAQNTYLIMDFQKSGSATMNQFIVEDAMGATAIEFVASLVFGTALGFIGGLLGALLTIRPTSGSASAS